MTETLKTIIFQFYGGLKIFLPKNKRRGRFSCLVKGKPAVKDTIEALGVPHPEVDCILVNGRAVGFDYHIKGNERISVYPDTVRSAVKKIKSLKPKPPLPARFMVDTHLGKLARYLRLLGFDTVYQRDIQDREIIERVKRKKIIVLTRDVGLLKNKLVRLGYFIRNTDPGKQIQEVMDRYGLQGYIKPFRLCLECNGKIRKAAKARIIDQLPPETIKFYSEFYQCRSCARVYWKGPHYQQLVKMIRKIK